MENTLVYACRAKDKSILEHSSSGGLFTVISDVFLDRGDAVLCSAYDYKEHRARFGLIRTKEARDAARGSMYMQSYALDSWEESLSWLRQNPGKRLLFIGTGCQAAAFRSFMERSGMKERAFVVDLVCHGAPSPRIWAEYALSLEKEGALSELNFKNKKTGWSHSVGTVKRNGQEISIRPFRRIYTDRYMIRPSCHVCPYTRIERDSDITIGDFWHLEKSMPDFADERGTSLLLIHTQRGRALFEQIRERLDCRESNTRDCWQLNLQEPTKPSEIRHKFWSDYAKYGIDHVMEHYGSETLLRRIERKIKKLLP